jgi:hypothetical protein
MKTKNMTTLHLRNSVNWSPLRLAFLFIPLSLMLTCFGLTPMAQAVGPDTDGTIPGSNNGEGIGVLVTRTTGVWNTGTGFEALSQLTAGNQNTATGLRALFSDTNGGFNTATGVYSLFSNTSGFFNSATGAYSLANNISGIHNTANGYAALYRNDADDNTATGFAALYHHTTGNANTANGAFALLSDTSGQVNTATGAGALFSNTTGSFNTANGASALSSNTSGADNTANGAQALVNNVDGSDNTALGLSALASNTSGSNNVALGRNAGIQQTTGSNNIYIGFNIGGTAGESDACYITSIFGQTSSGGIPVLINANHKLGTTTSSKRFKEVIKPMGTASEALLGLKPVTFRYKKGIDPQGIPQFGLVAEDVEAVNPDLVVRDDKGEIYTVRCDAVNAMLLNEFLKEHHKVEKLEAVIAQQQKSFQSKLAEQDKQIEALGSGLQKLSAQLELDRPAPRTVLNK